MIRAVAGILVLAIGLLLVLSPVLVAGLLGQPHDTPTRMINLRASWGGSLVGFGAFLAWLPSLRPRWRALVGLVAWAMAGIGAARLVGFALDGSPDGRQYVWLIAEATLAIVGGLALVLQPRAST